MHINNGWLTLAERILSPNIDDRPEGTAIDLLVIHNISLPPNQFGGGHIAELFTNCLNPAADDYFAEICGLKVSAHLLIDRLGAITQFAPFTQRAWHAGVSQFSGRERCNDFSIGIELEGLEHHPFEGAQYERLRQLIWSIQAAYPTVGDVVGHSDIAPGRKEDPGRAFRWEFFD